MIGQETPWRFRDVRTVTYDTGMYGAWCKQISTVGRRTSIRHPNGMIRYYMQLSKIRIVNFRGLKDLTLELDPITVLIGENNTGKSSVLAALQGCLGRSFTRRGSHFGDYDPHLIDVNAQPTGAAPIEIRLGLVIK